jgi:hypothetical protein
MTLHLTMTGVYAGQPICSAVKEPHDEGIHMIYAPLDKPEFRSTVCPQCIAAYVDSFDEDELESAPDWVKEAKKGTSA